MTFAKTETVIRLQAKLDAEGGDGELAAFVEEFDRLDGLGGAMLLEWVGWEG